MEHSGDNIDVTLVCPGPVITNIGSHLIASEQIVDHLKTVSQEFTITL